MRPLACCSEAGRRTGGHGQAAHDAEAVLQLNPYREIAYQQLTLAQAASGNRGGALLPCARCRRLLGGELGTTSSPALQALHPHLLRVRRRRRSPAAPPNSTPRGIRPDC